MNKNSIEEEIEILEELRTHGYAMLLMKYEDRIKTNRKIDQAIEHILSDYKRVLKENEIYKKNSEIMSKENLSTAEQLKVEIKENFRLKNQLENNRKENQETYKDVREELKELKKENEELLQEKINNQKIIALAQNDMLNYQAGFEDGKNGRTSAVQSIIENQQYYIFQKQIEKYEGHIEKLQKENEGLNNRCRNLDKEAQAYLEELAGDNTLTRRTIKQLQKENEECKLDVQDYLKQAQENAEMYRKAQKKIQDLKAENEELKNKLNLKQFDVNIVYNDYLEKLDEYERNTIPIQRIKDIIDRIDYDIKKTKEIISNNSNIYTSDRRNDYQIVRLKAMNTKSLDIKKRLQELLDGSDIDVGSIESEE